MFPQGGPGLALLLLRGSVLASFFATATRHAGLMSTVLGLAAVGLVALCLAIGFGTPVISVIAALAAVADIVAGPPARGVGVSGVLLLDAAALGLLGPGAYSIDARLFGRRVTVLPAPTDADH
jgi:hypothetical protein